MPYPKPQLVTLKDLRKLPSGKRVIPLIYLTKAQGARILRSAKPARLVPKTGGWLQLTPWPDGGYIARPCGTDDTTMVCIPQIRVGPGGVEIIGCDCRRVGEPESGGGSLPSRRPFVECHMVFRLTGGVTCAGQCPQGGTCQLVFIKRSGGHIVLGCSCG